MAYGTPTGPGDIANFYTDVRRGRPPTPEQLANLELRYQTIGGLSPLLARTKAQIGALDHALEEISPGEFSTFYGAKHSAPKIETTIDLIAKQGFTHLIGLVLAPHYSVLSVGEYIDRARRRAGELEIECTFIERWGADHELIDLLAGRLRATIGEIAERCSNFEVIFSAHSLPARVVELGDRYQDELAETAKLVASSVGLSHFRTGWQSAGRTPEPWLGPDLLTLLDQLRAESFDGVIVCPAGFTSDHLEILYDLDIEAANRAGEIGLAFARTASLNDDPGLASLLARRVVAARETFNLTTGIFTTGICTTGH